MDRKRIWGWWFFDWASQPYATLLLTFVFSIYFAEIAKSHFIALGDGVTLAGARAQALWGYGLSVSGVVIAVLAPILGAVADTSGRRMPWVWLFSALYVLGAAGLWFVVPEQPPLIAAVTLFGIGLIGMEFATIFTNAMLPGLAPRNEIGRLSGSGFAFGYVGGVVALTLMLALFAETPSGRTLAGIAPLFGLDPETREGTRFVGPFVAIWYAIFMVPFFLWVREPRGPRARIRLGAAMRDLGRLIGSLRHRRSLAAWLVSSMLSRDALNALYGFGGVYAGTVLGWPVFLAGIFGVVSAVSAAIISWLGGRADRRPPREAPLPVRRRARAGGAVRRHVDRAARRDREGERGVHAGAHLRGDVERPPGVLQEPQQGGGDVRQAGVRQHGGRRDADRHLQRGPQAPLGLGQVNFGRGKPDTP